METFIGFVIIAIACVLYFLPAIIASKRDHPNIAAIVLLNIFVGWTLLGWLGALIWSVAATPTAPAAQSTTESKTCPQCAESVKAAAKVCRFCGHPFTTVQTPLERAAAKNPERVRRFRETQLANLDSTRK